MNIRSIGDFAAHVVAALSPPLIAVALVAMLAVPAHGQVTDSLVVTILSPPNAVTIVGPERAYRADVDTILYEITDDAGNPTDGVATWTVEPQDRGTILEQTDSTVVVRWDQPGRVVLRVTVERTASIAIGGRYTDEVVRPNGVVIPAGTFQWADFGDLYLTSDEIGTGNPQLCAVGVSGEGVALWTTDLVCAENLSSLTGVVQPVDSNLLRRASIEKSYGVPPVLLDPGRVNFTITE